MKYIYLLIILFIISCTNDNEQSIIENLDKNSDEEVNKNYRIVEIPAADSVCIFPKLDEQTSIYDEENKIIPLIGSFEEIEENSKFNYFINPDIPLTRSSISYGTVTGFSNITWEKAKKGMFTVAFSKELGLPLNNIYIYSFGEVQKGIQIIPDKYPVTLFSVESPNCGWKPGGSNNEKGYSVSNTGNLWTLITRVLYVYSDVSGISINSYYPRHVSNIEWNYGVVVVY